MMNSRRRATAIVAALVLALSADIASAASVSVVGGLTREIVLQPGARTEGCIVLRNNTDQPQEVKVYQTDYLFWADGRNEYGEPGATPRSNAP